MNLLIINLLNEIIKSYGTAQTVDPMCHFACGAQTKNELKFGCTISSLKISDILMRDIIFFFFVKKN